MKSIRQSWLFLPIAMLLAVAGTVIGLSIVSSPQASALSGCSQYGWRNVTMTDYSSQKTYDMGTYPYYQTLRQGNANSCVASLQKMANVFCTQSTRLAVDGQFGPKTYSAIRSIQNAFANNGGYFEVRINGSRIIVDGVAGPQTWSILQAFSYWGSPNGGNIACA